MAAIVTFDWADRLIIEINSGLDRNELDVDEIYSEWKIAAQGVNNGSQAFSTIGPDVQGDVGAKFFLEEGWKIRPAEYDHTLILNGNLVSRIDDEVVPTLGGFTVLVKIKFSNIVDKFDKLAKRRDVQVGYAAINSR